MPHQHAEPAPTEPDTANAAEQKAKPFDEIQSISFADATSFAEIELQANQLLDYVSKLSSLADRACDTAIRQTESAQRIEDTRQTEVAGLRSQLDESVASLEAHRRELNSLENISKDQLTELESRLHERDTQLNERETELKHLRAEITCLINQLNKTEEAIKQTEDGYQERIDPLNQEIATLKTQLAQREELLQSKNGALRKVELDYRSTISNLEQRLRDMETNVQNQEAQLKEKDALIQATAGKEVEIGKLIKRLSTECQNLSVELQDKTRLLNELEGKKPQTAGEGNAWRRVIGKLQEEGL